MISVAFGALLCAPVVAASQGGAPTGRCKMQFTAEHGFQSVQLPSGQYNLFTGGSVVARCPSQGLVLRSDSLESYGDEGRIVFLGHVDYREPRIKQLKAQQLVYFQREERVLATQNVDATLPTGSNLKGNQVEFFRAIAGVRRQQSATAVGRPTISLVEHDAQGRPQPPVRVTGNTVYMLGDSIVSAVGEVVVVRPELTATGDSLYADAGSGLLRIMRRPKITGTKGRPFTLVGETIDLQTRQRKLSRVLAKNSAQATSEDLDLKSDSIDLRVSDDLLQRAVAWGKSRAHATSTTQSVIADSIDVLMPAQRLRELHAVRGASAEAMPDTSHFRTSEKDRLTGDTILARFDSVPARDTTSKPQIRLLIASGHATSLQHLAPRDTSVCVPAINYLRGRIITVTFDSATENRTQVNHVTVVDEEKAGGLQLEPQPDSTNLCRVIASRRTTPAPTTPTSRLPGSVPSAPPAAPPATTASPLPVKRP